MARKALTNFAPPLVTSLPTSPVDGQEVYYLATDDGSGLASVVWHLRYRAGSGQTYKWEYVGGAPLFDEVTLAETFNSFGGNTWGGINANDPQFAVPLAGDYLVESWADMSVNAVGSTIYVGIKVGATEPSTSGAGFYYSETAHLTGGAVIGQKRRIQAIPANTVLLQRYQHNGTAQNLSRGPASLTAMPIRVG
jgi:hypothetical protein